MSRDFNAGQLWDDVSHPDERLGVMRPPAKLALLLHNSNPTGKALQGAYMGSLVADHEDRTLLQNAFGHGFRAWIQGDVS